MKSIRPSLKKVLSRISALAIIIIALAVMASVSEAISATYYVANTGNDSSAGTSGAPWKTIGKAARTMVAGDTAIVMNGTYTEPEVVFKNSGTASAPITVRAQNKHQAILSSTSGCSPNISIFASHVTIDGLRSSISPSNVACASHNSADGTGVRCWHQSPATVSSPSTGYVGCVVRNMRIDGSSARSHAVKSTQDYALVETSILYSGIEVLNANSNVIRNNEIIGGDAWGASLVAKGGARNFEAYNNVVHIQSVWGQGIVLGGTTGTQWLYDPSSGIEAYNSVAYNNVVINEASGTALSYGMMGATDSALFNNVMKGGTLYLQGSGGSGKTPVNPTIKNNIFTCTGAQVLGQWSYTGQLSLDYNNFFNCSGVPTQAHPITGDPMFVNPSADWHLAPGSPAINSGTSVEVRGFKGEALTVNRDKDGKTRTTPWDLGIYETNSVTGDTTPPNAPSNLRLL